jgi:hypothetical protein
MNGLTDRRDEANRRFSVLCKSKLRNKDNNDRTTELKPRNE